MRMHALTRRPTAVQSRSTAKLALVYGGRGGGVMRTAALASRAEGGCPCHFYMLHFTRLLWTANLICPPVHRLLPASPEWLLEALACAERQQPGGRSDLE